MLWKRKQCLALLNILFVSFTHKYLYVIKIDTYSIWAGLKNPFKTVLGSSLIPTCTGGSDTCMEKDNVNIQKKLIKITKWTTNWKIICLYLAYILISIAIFSNVFDILRSYNITNS